MRIIKFRGKDVKTSHWVYGGFHKHIDITPSALYKDAESRENHIKEHTHYLIIQDAFSDYCMPRNIQCFDVASETIGQFTSLYDMNGKEIYEGDILDFNGLNIEVRFVRGVFALLCNGDLDQELCGDCRTDMFAKIIGNIHDNPDLLKGGDEWKG